MILNDIQEFAPVSTYRSRLRKQAEALLRAQSNGKHLRNQQKRIIIRWQQSQAKKRGTAA